jgi:hypothetical protein
MLYRLIASILLTASFGFSIAADNSATTPTTSSSELVKDGAFIMINNAQKNPPVYLNADTPSGATFFAATNWYSTWKLIAADDDASDVFYLYNEPEACYIGKTSTTAASQPVALNASKEDAGRYRIYHPDETDTSWYGIYDYDNASFEYCYLQIEPTNNTLINYRMKNGSAWAGNSKCNIVDPTPYFESWYDDLYSYNVGARVGDVDKNIVDAKMDALFPNGIDKGTWEAYNALQGIFEDPKNYIEPINGHYYRIHSAFPYFYNDYIAETYFAIDYHAAQGRQRLHFNQLDVLDNIVPTFWKYEAIEKEDDGEVYFHLIAANSGLAMRQVAGNTVLDTRPKDHSEAGVFSVIKNEDLLVYPHAVNIYCPKTGWYMATFSTNGGTASEVTDVRGSNGRREATTEFVDGANNWYMTEVTSVPVYFEKSDGTYDSSQEYYTSVCFPFAVKLPDNVSAYSATFQYGTDKTVKTTLIATNKIIPANSPVILKGPGGAANLTILYPDSDEYPTDAEPLSSHLVGALTPHAMSTYEAAYILDPDGSANVKLVIEGYDYSYDDEALTNVDANSEKNTRLAMSYPDYSLLGVNNTDNTRPITYILDANKAFVHATTITPAPVEDDTKEPERPVDPNLPDDSTIVEEEPTPAGIDNILEDLPQELPAETDRFGNIIYYDLAGRRITNPMPGLYILSNGKKVVVK